MAEKNHTYKVTVEIDGVVDLVMENTSPVPTSVIRDTLPGILADDIDRRIAKEAQ